MFLKLGFTGEALLRDHIRDRDGSPAAGHVPGTLEM